MFVVVFVVVVFLSEIVFAIYTLLYIFSAIAYSFICAGIYVVLMFAVQKSMHFLKVIKLRLD